MPERLLYFLPSRYFFHNWLSLGFQRNGLRVISVKKCKYHHLWEVRLKGGIAFSPQMSESQMAELPSIANDGLSKLVAEKIMQITKEYGVPVKADEVSAARYGCCFRAAFIWPVGRIGIMPRRLIYPCPSSWNMSRALN